VPPLQNIKNQIQLSFTFTYSKRTWLWREKNRISVAYLQVKKDIHVADHLIFLYIYLYLNGIHRTLFLPDIRQKQSRIPDIRPYIQYIHIPHTGLTYINKSAIAREKFWLMSASKISKVYETCWLSLSCPASSRRTFRWHL
jgi:hypothetical protein